MGRSALIYSVSLPFFHYTSQTRCLQCLCGSPLSRVLKPVLFGPARRPIEEPCSAAAAEARSGLRGLGEPTVLSAPVLSKRRPWDLHRTFRGPPRRPPSFLCDDASLWRLYVLEKTILARFHQTCTDPCVHCKRHARITLFN